MEQSTILERWTQTLGEATELDGLPLSASYRPAFGGPPAEVPAGGEQFEPLSELGRGGMGVVYRARQRGLEREVALKRLQTDGSGSGSSRCTPEDFVAEAVVTGSLEHPNIVPVYALEADEAGEPALAMKLITGRSWREQLAEEGPELDRDLDILLQVCNAVAFAHSKSITHNDLKPSNVMLGAFGEVLVVDWGLAVDCSAEPTPGSRVRHRSSIRLPCGTPNYIPPELALGEGDRIGPWTDIFLLGAILYEVLTGHPPRQGKSLVEVVVQAADGVAIALDADLPEELRQICLRALAHDPADRFPDVASFQDALRAFLRHRESLVISDAASRDLEALNAEFDGIDPDDEELKLALYDRFCACRFGFKQALRIWPENRAAKDHLQRALEWLIEYELGRGNTQSAGMLLPELPEKNAELAGRVSAERARQAEERAAERAELDALRQQTDPAVGQKERAWFAQTIAILLGGFALLAATAPFPITPALYALSGPLDLLAVLACVWIFRKSLLQRTINGRIASSVILIGVAIVVHRAVMYPLGLAVETAVALEMLLYSLTGAMMALAFDPRFAVAAGSFLVGALAAVAWPAYAWYALAAGSFIGMTALKKAWMQCWTTRAALRLVQA